MAISATTAWEVRTTGSDANGGGFDTATAGTDYSQQDSAQIAYTDLVINGATNTKCTSAANPFTSAHVGNIINITGGTGFTVQRVQVVSVLAAVATCDKSLGTLSSTGGTGNLGGGLLTIQAALDPSGSTNLIWIKSGTYTITTSIVKGSGGSTTIFLNGYGTTHGDLGTQPLITTSTNSVVLITGSWASGSNNIALVNLSLSSTAGTRGDGVQNVGNFTNIVCVDRCKISGVNNGIAAAGGIVGSSAAIVIVRGTEISSCVAAGAVVAGKPIVLLDCYIHGNGTQGFRHVTSTDAIYASGNLIVGNTGVGLQIVAGSNNTIVRNTIANNGGSGVTTGNSSATNVITVEDNIFYGNGAYGFEIATATFTPTVQPINRNNAYGANTTAARHILTAGQNDVTLSANPFTNSGSGDYSLNSTSGGGAACRGAGYPGVFPGGTTTGVIDIGAVQNATVSGPIPAAAELKGGITGTAYSETITAQGGVPTYSYAVTSGSLPTGLSLSGGGAITGTPTVAASYTFTVTVTDSAAVPLTGSQSFTIVIAAPVSTGGAYAFIG